MRGLLYILMDNWLHNLDVFLLVEGDQESGGVLYRAKTAVGESIPLNLQFAKNFLDLLEGPLDDILLARELEVVDVLSHQANEGADSIVSLFELQDKFSVDSGWDHRTSVLSNL